MGGYDPYSSSKGAAELVISAYRRSYFSGPDSIVKLASGRAGNVIGGGDWALDRIVPDCIRSLHRGEAIPVRNKVATRPWQHVLEPLSGYLQLGAALHRATAADAKRQLCGGFNFGPSLPSNRSVADLVEEILKHFPGHWDDRSDPHAVHEANLLNLATDRAFHFLKWQPVWDFPRTIERTVSWYRRYSADPGAAAALTTSQISDYTAEAKRLGIPWAP
jgi:CDP-glucose 4,6-dehydratase